MEIDKFVGLLGGGAHELKEAVVGFGHEVPGGAGVPTEAAVDELAGAAARGVEFFKDAHVVALACKESGGGKTCDTGANNNCVFSHVMLSRGLG
ncbi:hypothetical protein FRC0190_01902 [Corynebacterium rouxii]|uniref:Uncharacterized protein n=1 Tax=Corynebacterium rouxii TaxID=2719119 RepID=A0A6I8MIN1_9CORY|nr:hypothetical protein FRC0190_01902 [Corynebacterium rouxii]